MSAPRFKVPPPPGTPLSVNAGIRKEEFPCRMASLQMIAEILYRLKSPACVTKIDWWVGWPALMFMYCGTSQERCV